MRKGAAFLFGFLLAPTILIVVGGFLFVLCSYPAITVGTLFFIACVGMGMSFMEDASN